MSIKSGHGQAGKLSDQLTVENNTTTTMTNTSTIQLNYVYARMYPHTRIYTRKTRQQQNTNMHKHFDTEQQTHDTRQ